MSAGELFGAAAKEQDDQLHTAGAWPTGLMGQTMWRLPDGSVVSRDEALAWLKQLSQKGST